MPRPHNPPMRGINAGAYPQGYKAADVQEWMLPELETVWQDTYALSKREISVLTVTPYSTGMWLVTCREEFGGKREFHMLAHGFLSRFEPVVDTK